MNYGYKRQVNLSYEGAVEKMREALKTEGFGVITEIDVKAVLKKKLDVEFDNYIILGACNPPFAYEGLKIEREIGLLMPCNVVVYEEKGKTFVAGIRPTITMSIIDNPKLAGVAGSIEKKLQKAIDSI